MNFSKPILLLNLLIAASAWADLGHHGSIVLPKHQLPCGLKTAEWWEEDESITWDSTTATYIIRGQVLAMQFQLPGVSGPAAETYDSKASYKFSVGASQDISDRGDCELGYQQSAMCFLSDSSSDENAGIGFDPGSGSYRPTVIFKQTYNDCYETQVYTVKMQADDFGSVHAIDLYGAGDDEPTTYNDGRTINSAGND